MTHEENQRCAINYLIELKKSTKGYGANWLDLAIKALEAQSMDTKTYLKRREENYIEYNVEWFLKNWELELEILSGGKIKPTDADCISRQKVIDLTGKSDWFESSDDYNDFVCAVCDLPSVTPQPKIGHWIIEEVKDEDGRPYDIKYFCSECQAERPPIWDDYCSACGAKMEVEDKESEE